MELGECVVPPTGIVTVSESGGARWGAGEHMIQIGVGLRVCVMGKSTKAREGDKIMMTLGVEVFNVEDFEIF